MNEFIKDDYFSKGHWLIKISQTIVSIFMWIVVITPLVITFSSTIFTRSYHMIYQWHFKSGLLIYHILTRDLFIFFFIFSIIGFFLTIKNNYIITNQYKKKVMYDEISAQKKRKLLENFYTERFGEKILRESSNYLKISPEKNVNDDEISEYFKENGL